MNFKFTCYILFAVLVLSCKSDKLPPVPASFIEDAYQKVDHIDYYFRNTNFSVSQSEVDAVGATISLLSSDKATQVGENCVSPLRMTYLSQGNIMFETEMYMTENCLFVEYYINNVKTYQSAFTQEGYNFLVNIINSANSSRE